MPPQDNGAPCGPNGKTPEWQNDPAFIRSLTPELGSPVQDDDAVVKAALVAIIASGMQRGLRPSQVTAEILADKDVASRLSTPAPNKLIEALTAARLAFGVPNVSDEVKRDAIVRIDEALASTGKRT